LQKSVLENESGRPVRIVDEDGHTALACLAEPSFES
jgi:hypothetical protein